MRRSLSRLAGLLLLAPTACGGGGGNATGGLARNLEVRLHDTPVESAEHLWVTIDRVEVHRSVDGVETKEDVVTTPAQYDVLALQGGVEAVLGGGAFPPGDYTSIRLVVAADTKEEIAAATDPATLKNYIVVDGEPHPLVVPSGAQTGLKLNHAFTLSADAITVLTIDFDVRRSVTQRGHQQVYNLRPTLRLVDTVVSGSISGVVSSAGGGALPAGTFVSAQAGGEEAASAFVDTATGAYEIGPLLGGVAYDLVFGAPGHAWALESGVAVTANQENGGHDATLLPSPTGDLTGTVTGASLEGLVVVLRWDGRPVATTGVDPTTGAYQFQGLPVDEYTLDVLGAAVLASAPATVTDGAVSVVDVVLP